MTHTPEVREITKPSIEERLTALEERIQRISEWDIATVRIGIADEMQEILCSTNTLIPPEKRVLPKESLQWPIDSVRKRVPNKESLVWEAERFITLVRNLLK